MRNKKTLLLILLAFVLLLGGAYALYEKLGQEVSTDQLATEPVSTYEDTTQETSQEETQAERALAPDFTVYDLDGNEVHLSDFIGKPIVLNFWASWCGPCKGEMPDFHEKYLELGDSVQFLMINMTSGRETLDTASAFIMGQGYTFPVFYDTDSDAAITYGVYSLPTTFFIDAQGCAIAQATGAIDEETLQIGIDMITES